MRRASVVILWILLTFPGALFAQSQRIVLGIMPVYDASGEEFNRNFVPNLTYLLFDELGKSPDLQSVLLSPGGLYDPDGEDWILSYAHKANVDAVLVARQLPSAKAGDHHRILKYEVQVLDVATGKRSLKAQNDTLKVATDDLVFGISGLHNPSAAFRSFWTGSPQEFRKQPAGKIAVKLAEWTNAYLTSALTALQPTRSGAAEPSASAPCSVAFRINYVGKHSSSKAYSVTANGLDQSSTIREGVAHFSVTPGPLALRIRVEDAPYRVPTEELYQNSTILDCFAKEHTLVMEMGGAGEALLHWE